jgi:hypothetical protein
MTTDTYVAISSLAVAGASLIVSVIATLFAKGSLNRAEDSLRQAEKIASRGAAGLAAEKVVRSLSEGE